MVCSFPRPEGVLSSMFWVESSSKHLFSSFRAWFCTSPRTLPCQGAATGVPAARAVDGGAGLGTGTARIPRRPGPRAARAQRRAAPYRRVIPHASAFLLEGEGSARANVSAPPGPLSRSIYKSFKTALNNY